MYKTSIFGLIALAATASARPATLSILATAQALQITNLSLSDSSASGSNSTFAFDVYNPDPLTKATATCTGSWAHSNTTGNPQSRYALCGNSTFAWNFANYTSFEAFTINVEDRFTDPSVGDPPYDQITEFAKADVNTTVIACDIFGAQLSCHQKPGVIIYAPVYAATA